MSSQRKKAIADLEARLDIVSDPIDRADIMGEMSELLLGIDPDRSIALCREAVALIRADKASDSTNGTQQSLAFKQVNSLLRNLPKVVLYLTGGGVEFISSNVENVIGYSVEEITEDRDFFPKIIHDDDLKDTLQTHLDWRNSGAEGHVEIEFRVRCKDGSTIWLLDRMRVEFRMQDGRRSYIGAMIDITERKNIEADRENLITELKEALTKIKTLKGLIPICANCKKIRDDKGFWNRLESYFSKHSETTFTHGICPDCKDKLYPELKRG